MKAARFPFLILLLAVSVPTLMPGRSYAAASQTTSAQEPKSPRRATDKNHPRSRANLTTPNHPKQLLNTRKRSTPGNTANFHHPDPSKSGAAANDNDNDRLVQNQRGSTTMPRRPQVIVRPTAATLNSSLNPLPGNVRHRGPNSAVVGVGGSPNLNSSNTGAINGTRMHRRP
jgi:hypothetical protein